MPGSLLGSRPASSAPPSAGVPWPGWRSPREGLPAALEGPGWLMQVYGTSVPLLAGAL